MDDRTDQLEATSTLAQGALDTACLDYYRVRRCFSALVEGSEGQAVWRHPGILKDLLDWIQSLAGVEVTVPG